VAESQDTHPDPPASGNHDGELRQRMADRRSLKTTPTRERYVP
jgi:hypothetical protein